MRTLEELKRVLATKLDPIELLDMLEMDTEDLVEALSDIIEENQEEIEERLGDWESDN